MTSTEQQAAIDAALIDVATNDKTTSFEGVTSTRQSIQEIILADRHLARKNKAGLGIRMGRMTTTGASL